MRRTPFQLIRVLIDSNIGMIPDGQKRTALAPVLPGGLPVNRRQLQNAGYPRPIGTQYRADPLTTNYRRRLVLREEVSPRVYVPLLKPVYAMIFERIPLRGVYTAPIPIEGT